MTLAKGPRPWTIRFFVIFFLLSALIALIDGLADLEGVAQTLSQGMPNMMFSQDALIVILAVRMSIALIPVVLVWFLASRFAQLMAALLSLGKLVNVPDLIELMASGEPINPWWGVSLVLGVFAGFLLFMPASLTWFRTRGTDLAAVFD
jgi:hypothetical protein